jgi:twitching motility protein PilT
VSVTPPPRPAPALSERQRVEGPALSERQRVEGPPQPAVVLQISRSPIRIEPPPSPATEAAIDGLDRLLRVSAARGASALYLSSDAQPSVRVDGELQMLDGEPELTARDVESLLLTLMPERSHEALRTGATTEWIVDIEDVGRVRCMSFRDHHGPGGVFRLMPMRSVSVDQLGLPREIQALAIEPEGLVLVAGPRSSGKRTLMAAYVDLINRSRRDHVITIEREINIVHERGQSFVSQREVRGNDDDLLAAARAALREDPDVLVIEDLRTGALMNVALEASASGHLVIGGFSAHTAAAAIDRIIDLYAPEYRRQVQLALADNLRGVIVQVLLHKTGGGRVAAREVLLNTPAVASALAEGKTSQLAMAIEGGRRLGMTPLNDALVGFVQSGTVDSREAYRYSSDRAGFLAQLKRQGLDTSFVERLA